MLQVRLDGRTKGCEWRNAVEYIDTHASKQELSDVLDVLKLRQKGVRIVKVNFAPNNDDDTVPHPEP